MSAVLHDINTQDVSMMQLTIWDITIQCLQTDDHMSNGNVFLVVGRAVLSMHR